MIRSLIIAPAALLVSTTLLFAAAGPAAAAEADRCATAPAQVRAAAQAADPQDAKRALRYLQTAEKLCEAGSDRAADKKLEQALRTLGLGDAQQLAAAAN